MTGSSNYVYAKHPPKSGIDYPLNEIIKQAHYSVKADADTNANTFTYDSTASGNSTTNILKLWTIPANTMLVGIGWYVVDGFRDAAGALPVSVDVRLVGSTAGIAETRLCMFNQAELSDCGISGVKHVWFGSTDEAKVYAFCDSGGTPTAGGVGLWLIYRPSINANTWV